MATDINTILSWFKTGLKPTQAQFWASWTSFWHKDEMIPQSSISNLTNVLNAKVENDQFDAHKEDPNAHPELFGKIGFIQVGKFLVFKHPNNSDPTMAYTLEANDLVMGYVGLIWITGNYLGGDITQLESFDISTKIN
ncbi:hypothetical protein OIU83_17860 [Flavobacterium sp. LS1R49]|uniref:Uncharacterized protein n=1 Tax=Flavobacterium shii TaxID=2987687 RepID=A0A9X3C6D7_9FLAO|nr:hypothetical protein [Flavobacterium shii]MCV9929532.1 hypothetical protein [Flavobacterium shii]